MYRPSSTLCHRIAILALLLSIGTSAGGIHIDGFTLLVNSHAASGNSRDIFRLPSDSNFEMNFTSDCYEFSHKGDFGYAIITLNPSPLKSLSTGVGPGKTNRPEDVLRVQKTLNRNGYFSGNEDERLSDELVQGIKSMQADARIAPADGIISLGSETETQFYRLEKTVLLVPLNCKQKNSRHTIVTFELAQDFLDTGKYELEYFAMPIFHSDTPLPASGTLARSGFKSIRSEMFRARGALRERIRRWVADSHFPFTKLGTLRVVPALPLGRASVYLKVNGLLPSVQEPDKEVNPDKPLLFSWEVRPRPDTAIFRYRVLPDTEWSSWTVATAKVFHYLPKGTHNFELDTKFRMRGTDWEEAPRLVRGFQLRQPLIADQQEYFAKAAGIILPSISSIASPLYQSKAALLFGVMEYEDTKFGPLPYVKDDVQRMKTSLRRIGFDTEAKLGRLHPSDILEAIKTKLSALSQDDFLLVYISSHGFNSGARAFLATSSCQHLTGANCLSLDTLGSALARKNHKARHVLVLLDACSAGIGIIGKDAGLPEQDMVMKPGALIVTAGLENQVAQMKSGLSSSVFTYFISKGIEGEADFAPKDGYISITELLLYVRRQVAVETKRSQVPMMGRLWGSGEMVLRLSKN